MKLEIKRLDHVQVCVPRGSEEEARDFYGRVLGLEEIEKPEPLRASGGFWYKTADTQLHVGVEDEVAASKRHPAFEVARAEEFRRYLESGGVRTRDETPIPGVLYRFSFYDPFGNRIELLERAA